MGRTEASRWLQAAERKAGGAKGPFIDAVRWALDTISELPPGNPQSRLTETVAGEGERAPGFCSGASLSGTRGSDALV